MSRLEIPVRGGRHNGIIYYWFLPGDPPLRLLLVTPPSLLRWNGGRYWYKLDIGSDGRACYTPDRTPERGEK